MLAAIAGVAILLGFSNFVAASAEMVPAASTDIGHGSADASKKPKPEPAPQVQMGVGAPSPAQKPPSNAVAAPKRASSSPSATTAGEPYMQMDVETVFYSGQQTVICWDSGYVWFTQGSREIVCVTLWPHNADGSPASFSPNNTIRIQVRDGCGTVRSDTVRYNVYSGTGENPPVLHGLTPVGSNIIDVPWGNVCSGGWTIAVSFSGSTLDGTPVNSTTSRVVDALPPPPPPPVAPEQTLGDGAPWHVGQGDPVDSLTGAFNYHPDGKDLGYISRGGFLSLGRSYASNVSRPGRFGPGWSDSFDATLTAEPNTGNVSYHDPAGPVQTFTPDGNGGYTAPLGGSTKLAATATGWTLISKDQTTRTFDQSGQLTAVTDRNGQGVTLAWSGGRLASIAGSSRTLTLGYNSDGLVSSLTGSDGRSVTYRYDTGRLHGVVDAAGFTTTYGYDAGGRLSSVQDANGNFPIRVTYDQSSGRALEQQDADGKSTQFTWQPSGTDPQAGTAVVTDPRGNTITDTYENGYLTSQTDGDGNTSRFVWNSSAQLATFVDQVGNTTRFDYDASGNLAKRTGPDNSAESYTYNDRNDIVESTDFNGNKTTYTYTAAGNPETIQRASLAGATTPVVATRLTYNPDGTIATSSDALNRITSYGYNGQGDLTSVTSPEGRKTSYVVDAAGRTAATVEPRGNVTGATPDNFRTTFSWDNLDRLTTTTDPLGHATSVTFDPAGRVDHVADAKQRRTTYTYGATNLPTAIQGPDPSIPPQRFTYDANGNVATATSPAGVVATYTYTKGNVVRTVSSTGTGTWTYDYDPTGRLSKLTAPSGRSVTLSRTVKGQVSNLTYSDGTPGVSYTYDANGNRTSLTDAQSTTSYAYNALNAATAVAKSGSTYTFGYDEAGQVTSSAVPDGSAATSYGYDRDGRLTAVTSAGTTLAAYTYDNATGKVTTTLPGGVTQTAEVDAAQRPLAVQGQKGTTTLTKSRYTLDEVGNPTQILNANGTTDSFAYDLSDRLVAACYNATACASNSATAAFRYAYDADGNITTVTQPTGATTYTYNSTGQLTSRSGLKGAASYQYDADGNTTSAGTTGYTWNAAGQLTKVTNETRTVTYTYDGDNHRVATSDGKTTTNSSYDPLQGALAFEKSGSKTLRHYTYGLGLVGMTAGNASYGYLTDSLGSVRGVTSSAGALALGYDYQPYGESRATTTGKSAPTNPLQFTGSYLTSPLYQMGARDYSPADGRFLAPDPAGIPGRGYGYASGNPLTATDPTGLSDFDWRKLVNTLANGVADVATGGAVVCTVAFAVCGEVVPVAAGLSWAASAVSVATSDQTTSCLSGHGACPQAIVTAAVVGGTGRFGLGREAGDELPYLLRPGDFATNSIPARSASQNFTQAERDAINKIGYADGCHSCGVKNPGTKSGNFVPDHQPVSALTPDGTPQQLYPHCLSCMRQQGGLVSKILRGQ